MIDEVRGKIGAASIMSASFVFILPRSFSQPFLETVKGESILLNRAKSVTMPLHLPVALSRTGSCVRSPFHIFLAASSTKSSENIETVFWELT